MVWLGVPAQGADPGEGGVTMSVPRIGNGLPAAELIVPVAPPTPLPVVPSSVKSGVLVLTTEPPEPAPPPAAAEPTSSNSDVVQSPPPPVPVVQSTPALTAYTPLALVLVVWPLILTA